MPQKPPQRRGQPCCAYDGETYYDAVSKPLLAAREARGATEPYDFGYTEVEPIVAEPIADDVYADDVYAEDEAKDSSETLYHAPY